MARFQELPPTFHVLYSDDFATKLSIPTPAAKEHKGFLCQIFVTLTTESGLSWEVEIEKIDGAYHFTDGWSEFVNDNNLVDRQLLLFHIVGDSTLQVSSFGDHCWLKPPRDEGETTLRFIKELKNFNMGRGRRMDIPRDFAESIGIATSKHIELEDETGRKWPISITNNGRYSMNGGWPKFLKGNNLQIGNILLFEFVPDSDSVVKVSVMEEGAGRELIAQAKCGGFLGERRSLRFVKELKDFNFTGGRMFLPKGFAVGTGIATSNPLIVIDLEDDSERKWPVAVTHRKSGQYSLTGGWLDFLKGNNHMQIGTVLLFEYVPDSDNVVKVSAMEERAGRELLHQAGHGGLL